MGEHKINKNKIGAIFLISILSIAGISISYASFYDEITVYGKVETSTVELEWTSFSNIYVWIVYCDPLIPSPLWADPEMFTWSPVNNFAMLNWFSTITPDMIENWFTEELNLLENVDYWRVAWSEVTFKEPDQNPDGFDKEYDINMFYNNVHPNLDFCAEFLYQYTGTIPAKWTKSQLIDTWYIENGPFYTGDGYYGDNWMEDLWIYNHGITLEDGTYIPGNPGMGIWIEAYMSSDPNFENNINNLIIMVPPPPPDDNQLHEGYYIYIKICINIPQDDQFQGCSGLLQNDLNINQWSICD
jgi:hypothetical protein